MVYQKNVFLSPFSGIISLEKAGIRVSENVWLIKNAVVLFDYGVVVKDGFIVKEVSPDIGGEIRNHSAFRQRSLPKHSGKIHQASLASGHAHQVYYHWFMDIVPRIKNLRDELSRVPKLIVNSSLPYQVETLRMMGLNKEKIINPKVDSYYSVDELYVTPCQNEYGLPAKSACDFVRILFHEHLSRSLPNRRIFLSRDDALTRRLNNSKEVRNLLVNKGFEIIECSKYSIAEQAKIFSEACVVIGSHGAAFTNMIFSPHGARFLELMPLGYENNCYKAMAYLLNISITRLSCSDVSNNGSFNFLVDQRKLDLEVDKILQVN